MTLYVVLYNQNLNHELLFSGLLWNAHTCTFVYLWPKSDVLLHAIWELVIRTPLVQFLRNWRRKISQIILNILAILASKWYVGLKNKARVGMFLVGKGLNSWLNDISIYSGYDVGISGVTCLKKMSIYTLGIHKT